MVEPKEVWHSHDRIFSRSEAQEVREGAKYGFDIRALTQTAQSPDYKYNDLSFFNSMNSDVRIQSMSNDRDGRRQDIQDAPRRG